MSPLLSTLANASALGYRSLVAGAATSFESIATVSVGSGGSSSVEFTSIPGTYAHLQIRAIVRGTNNVESQVGQIQFNSDTASGNYTVHDIYGDGSSAAAAGEAGGYTGGAIRALWFPCATALSNTFMAGVLDILDYKDTNKYKTVRRLIGWDQNNDGEQKISFGSHLWLSTSAITSIKLQPYSSGSFAQYSHFGLYGIKGA